jgi:cation diffusion facilitator family transporter
MAPAGNQPARRGDEHGIEDLIVHTQSTTRWQHQHRFLADQHGQRERRTWMVVALTSVMMVAEIIGGSLFGSMALLADGWHMATHAAALSIAAFAYLFARRHAADRRFTFGTGKVGELAGFASAIALGLVAVLIAYESLLRLYSPVSVNFNEAIAIAVLGLGVNLVSAWLLGGDHHGHGHAHEEHGHHHHDHAHHEHHDHDDDHHHHRGHEDHNLRAAFLHVLADALTSVLAIVGLLTARYFGWIWIDPLVGIVGACVIAVWSYGLIRSSAAVLLDVVPDRKLVDEILRRMEVGGDRISDLHIWRVGPGHNSLIVSVVAEQPQDPDIYKARLKGLDRLSHITVEVHGCPDHLQAAA